MASVSKNHPWLLLSNRDGVMVQSAGLGAAIALVRRAARGDTTQPTGLLLVSWVIAYFNCHALAHWLVGRLGRINFTGFGIHGTTMGAWYPPGMRWVIQHLPFWSARTEPSSRRAAAPLARAAMYAAGPFATIGISLGLPLYARRHKIPGATWLLRGAAFWIAGMMFGELAPHSDVRRAWRELRRIG